MSGTATAAASVNAKSIDQRIMRVYGSVAFVDETGKTDYASGGLALDLSPAGMAAFNVAVPANPVAVQFMSPGGFLYSYDATNKKILEFVSVGTEHTAAVASDFAGDVPVFIAHYVR